jgi:hypothetical protein
VLAGFDRKQRRALSPDEVKAMLEQLGGVSSDG